jgi:alkylhydroperoxidase/carboxymuconolactone decarboxylase family protein YurZ
MTGMEILKERAPDVLESYFNMIKTLQRRCPLDEKTKELVLLGILTANQSDHGIPIHIKRAKENGATDEEIITVIVSALPSCGMGTVLKALEIAKGNLNL